MVSEERYLILRGRLTNFSCSGSKLRILKEYFKISIDSDRRFDRIRNLHNLIRILEKRDIINPNNIESIRYIADVLESNEIIQLIDSFNAPEQTERIRPNVTAQPEAIRQNFTANNTGRVLPVTNSDPVERVYDLICQEIGQNWKAFARKLKISEGFIDQLEFKHRNNMSEMVREVITYHKENCDLRYWKSELCNALADARRKDLSRKVQKIFAMHSIE